MAAAGAVLTRLRGCHSHHLPAGPCYLANEKRRELGPRPVMNALGKLVIRHHLPNGQLLDHKEVSGVVETTTRLVGEVAAPPPDALVHAGDVPATTAPLVPSRAPGCVLAHEPPHLLRL